LAKRIWCLSNNSTNEKLDKCATVTYLGLKAWGIWGLVFGERFGLGYNLGVL